MNFFAVLISAIGLVVLHYNQLTCMGATSAYKKIEFENANFNNGVNITDCTPAAYVYVADHFVVLGFTEIDFAAGALLVNINFSDNGTYGHIGVIDIHLDDPTSQSIASVKTGITMAACTFYNITTFLEVIPSSVHDLYFTFNSPSPGGIVGLDWFEFKYTTSP